MAIMDHPAIGRRHAWIVQPVGDHFEIEGELVGEHSQPMLSFGAEEALRKASSEECSRAYRRKIEECKQPTHVTAHHPTNPSRRSRWLTIQRAQALTD
jgi:hypothetical protein